MRQAVSRIQIFIQARMPAYNLNKISIIKGDKVAARPPEGGPTEVGGLSASNLPLFDTPSNTNARRSSKSRGSICVRESEYVARSSMLLLNDARSIFIKKNISAKNL